MATPPTRIAVATPTGNYTTATSPRVTTTSLNCLVGDVVVVAASSEQAGTNATVTPTASAGTFTWALPSSSMVGTSNQSGAKMWVGTCTAAGNATFSLARINTGTALWWGMSATQWRGVTAVNALFTTAPTSGTSNTIAQATTIALQANSGVQIAFSDWNAVNLATRTYQTVNGAAMTESLYVNGASHATAYGAFRTDVGTAGTKTVGLTTPATLRWVMVGVELVGSSASTPGQGSGTGSVVLAGVAAGKRIAQASASAALAFIGSSTGKRAPKAAATGSLSFTGSAVGDAPSPPPSTGSGTGSVGFTGAATGKRVAKASGSSTVTITGSASGRTVRRGTGTGSLTTAGTATGKRTPRASGNATLAFVGTATGKRAPKSPGGGSVAFAGTAVGNSPTPGLKEGFGSGSVAWAGTATGRRTPKGSGSGAVALVGSSAGRRTPLATGTGSLTYAGTAVGQQPGLPTEFAGRILSAAVAAPVAVGTLAIPSSTGDLVSHRASGRLSILRAKGVIA